MIRRGCFILVDAICIIFRRYFLFLKGCRTVRKALAFFTISLSRFLLRWLAGLYESETEDEEEKKNDLKKKTL